MSITWSLAYDCGQQQIYNDTKYMSNAEDLEHHADAAVQCGAHRPINHIPGFTRSHWMPPLGECMRHISPAAAMVNEYVATHKTLTKHNF
jgi:hypothetical protein